MPSQSPRDKSSAIREQLRAEILEAGQSSEQPTRLGTEAELCARFDVARNTLRKALTALADEGLIYSKPTRGWFIGQRSEPTASVDPSAIIAELRNLISSGRYAPGQKFATAPEIASKYGAPLHTARQVLSALSMEALIESRHGKGWYVIEDGRT